jgi:hypothetical protein
MPRTRFGMVADAMSGSNLGIVTLRPSILKTAGVVCRQTI